MNQSRFLTISSGNSGLLVRTIALITLVGIFLALIYSTTPYYKLVGGDDFLWLVLVAIGLTVARQGNRKFILITISYGCIVLTLTEVLRIGSSASYSSFCWMVLIKNLWLVGGSIALYLSFNYSHTRTLAFQVVESLTEKWSRIYNLDELAQITVQELVSQLGYDEVNIFLDTPQGLVVTATSSQLIYKNFIDIDYYFALDKPTPNSEAFLTRGSVIVNDIAYSNFKDLADFYGLNKKVKSEMVVPLMVSTKPLGTLEILSYSKNSFFPEDERLVMTIAVSLSTVMKNMIDLKWLDSQRELLDSLKTVIERLSGLPFSIIQESEILKEIVGQGQAWSSADLVLMYELELVDSKYQIISEPCACGSIAGKVPLTEQIHELARSVECLEIPYFLDDILQNQSPSMNLFNMFFINESITSLVSLPLWKSEGEFTDNYLVSQHARKLIGIIFFGYHEKQLLETDFDRQQLFNAFAGLAGLAIQRLRTYEEEIKLDSERRWRVIHEMTLTHLSRLIAITQDQSVQISNIEDAKRSFNLISNAISDLSGIVRLEFYSLDRTTDQPLNDKLSLLFQRLRRDSPNREFYLEISAVQEIHELPNDWQIHLYAIALESITNAIKHGNARAIWVEVYYEDEAVNLMIEDNGAGFDPDKITRRSGLTNIERRAQLMGGKLFLDAREDRSGVIVTVSIPVTSSSAS